MQLQTIVDIPKSEWQISHDDKLLFIGSCFADEIGELMKRCGFDVMVNPFGTLYNPASIAALLLRSISERVYDDDSPEVFYDETMNMWHSWMHHTRFSAADKQVFVQQVNSTLIKVAERLRETDVLIVTLGTAIIYQLKDNGMLVANCHKQPDRLFVRERMNAYDIVDQWNTLIEILQSINPKLKILMTISPIRHKRDGYHTNQISKGVLLQAVDELPVDYFPAYEIMMDELRDYRYYADDMIHPSPVAVRYIWERFTKAYFSNITQDRCSQFEKEYARSQHRRISQS